MFEHIWTGFEQVWTHLNTFKQVLNKFEQTRSYAALRAADLDWTVGPGYSLGGYILEKNHENQPKTMKNQPGTIKNHEKPIWNHEKPWKPT